MTKMMMKFGIVPNLPIGQGSLSSSLQGGMSMLKNSSSQNPVGSIMQIATKLPDHTSQGLAGYDSKRTDSSYVNTIAKNTSIDTAFGSRTEKVLSNFLQNPVLKGEGSELNEVVCYGWNKFICRMFAWFIGHFCLLEMVFNHYLLKCFVIHNLEPS